MMPKLELRHWLTESQVMELLALYRNEWWSRDRDSQPGKGDGQEKGT